MGYKIAMDFGTTYTYVFTKKDNELWTRYGGGAGGQFSERNDGIPTVLAKKASGEWCIGQFANGTSNTCQDIVGTPNRLIKRTLRELSTPVDDDANNEQKDEKLEQAIQQAEYFFSVLFQPLLTQCREENAEIELVVCGAPAATMQNVDLNRSESGFTDTLHYNNILGGILQSVLGIDRKKIFIRPEPVLAGSILSEATMFSTGGGAPWRGIYDQNVLVIDMGGGTNDMALLHFDSDGVPFIEPTVHPEGGTGPAGQQVNEAIQQKLQQITGHAFDIHKIQYAKAEIFQSSYDLSSVGWTYFSASDCPEYSVGIYYDDNARHRERLTQLTNVQNIIRFREQLNFEQDIYQAVWRRIEAFVEKIQRNGVPIHKVLFVGGGARMFPLRAYVEDKLQEKLRIGMQNMRLAENMSHDAINRTPITCSNVVAAGACLYADNEALRNTNNPLPQANFYICRTGDNSGFPIRFSERGNDGVAGIVIHIDSRAMGDKRRIILSDWQKREEWTIPYKERLYFRLGNGLKNAQGKPIRYPASAFSFEVPDGSADLLFLSTPSSDFNMYVLPTGGTKEVFGFPNVNVEKSRVYESFIKRGRKLREEDYNE